MLQQRRFGPIRSSKMSRMYGSSAMSSTHGHRRWDFVFIFLMSATRASSDSNRSRQWRARSALIARTGDRNPSRWNDCTWVSVRTFGTASDLLVLREELIELALVRLVVEEVVGL